jgi:hypothetical protein
MTGVVGATAMNTQSSRSHAIFTITIENGNVGEDGKQHIKMGKLHLVDLAVSDYWSLTSYLVLTFVPHFCSELCFVSVWYLFYYELYFYILYDSVP